MVISPFNSNVQKIRLEEICIQPQCSFWHHCLVSIPGVKKITRNTTYQSTEEKAEIVEEFAKVFKRHLKSNILIYEMNRLVNS